MRIGNASVLRALVERTRPAVVRRPASLLPSISPAHWCAAWLAAFFVLGLVSTPVLEAQMVDLNGNGMSDIWELIYGAASLDPNGDADGDGLSNLQESIAGTDPFDAASAPRLVLGLAGTNLLISIPGALGKRYELQSLAETGSDPWTNWTTEAGFVLRSGTNAVFSLPPSGALKFFRIAISDVDSDGDGVNDWEEYQVGLDPFNATSNGQLNSAGRPLTDYEYVTSRLAVQNLVTISATVPAGNQPDPGQRAINQGLLTINRGGFPLNAITVSLGPGTTGPGVAVEGVDYASLPRALYFPVGISSQTLTVTPLANPNLTAPVVATVQVLGGSGYRVGKPQNASVVIYPSGTPSGGGLRAQYFVNSSATYDSTANLNPANLLLTRTDPVIDFTWNSTTNPITNSGFYSVRWTGQVQPEYSETYYFVANTDDGVKLWVNDHLVVDKWVLQGPTDSVGAIPLQAGLRYNIQMDYFNGGGPGAAHLSWYSASQPKQVIPSARLYPAAASKAPSAVTSPLTAVAFVGQPFSFTVTGANTPGAFSATGLPAGLSFDPPTGLITGTPLVVGDYQVLLTASNAFGLGASILALQVIDSGSSVVREIWLNVPGTNIADIPLGTPSSSKGSWGTLEGVTSLGIDYGERVRGYFTAPITGNYYFWISGSDSAELWISNDNEPANKVRRAYVSPAIPTGPRRWDLAPAQRSPWLTLIAGQKYYLEVLHKAGDGGVVDNWAVGWAQDATGTNLNPAGVVPGFVLSPYYPPPPSAVPGTLYTANMLAQALASSTGLGTASLRVSPDGSQAVLNFRYSGLSSPVTGEHIHCDPYLNNPSQIMFDIDTATPRPDGSYVWNIGPVGTLSAADILEIIREGKAYINVHTVNYPAGEINGHFTLASGMQTFAAPPPCPAWTDDHTNASAAARFLLQASFGPSPAEVAAVQSLGYEGWIDNQFSLPPTHHLPFVLTNVNVGPNTPYPTTLAINSWWQQSLTAPDQLRQRVAFALSEIMVVSGQGVLNDNARALSAYYDTLLDNAFGNFRELLEAVTLSPAMGSFLDMRHNDKGNIVTGLHPNENYAREIMQLFSIGLYRLWPDGTLVMDSRGNLVPTYNQNVIMGFAGVFTGWNYFQSNQPNGRLPTNFSPPANYVRPMVLVPTHHELGTKLLLDNVMLPQAWGTQANPTSTNFDFYCSQDLEQALDSICNHQNVGPFICRQLVQRLVASNPSRDYLYRVVRTFNDNGSGVRGDLQAVIKSILLDYEARSSVVAGQSTFGKQREPLLRASGLARAFPPPSPMAGSYSENGTRTITVSTSGAHRLNSGDTVILDFTHPPGAPTPPPASQAYGITVVSPSAFTINAPGMMTGTYTQAVNVTVSNMLMGNWVVTNAISVNLTGHGLAAGNAAYLSFISGGASNGVYQVISTTNANSFTVATADTNSLSGNALVPKLTSGGYVRRGTNVTLSFSIPHGLKPGDPVYIKFTSGTALNGTYAVAAVPDDRHFTVIMANSTNQTANGAVIYPLLAPPLVRSGTVLVQFNTWNVGTTDRSLTQTPLYSPTVFNFFFPDYKFAGALASAGLTTPEFQLTTDTDVAIQMNFLEGGLLNNTGNTNGLSSFVTGGGAVVLDLGPWMTAGYTSNAGIPGLADALSSLLTGRAFSPQAKNAIVSYVANNANFPFSATPTLTQMRDRVRAVVHLIACSPDYTIQQ